ncbi:MAG: gliding motility-associated C-terminal domain-containing protein [Marinifilaceae bacterium]|jgi:gliding motility-associated-like protein|nr:gliding motility-associated C-terminal domain-containing protein [Marinifilaceae bacterium]
MIINNIFDSYHKYILLSKKKVEMKYKSHTYKESIIISFLISFFIILGSDVYSRDMGFENSHTSIVCPKTNTLKANQTCSIRINGPSTPWKGTYNVNGGPELKLNGGNLIRNNRFFIDLSYRNDKSDKKRYTVRLLSMTKADGTAIAIPPANRQAKFEVWPNYNPEIIDTYDKIIKKGKEVEYQFKTSLYTSYRIEIPTGASITHESSSDEPAAAPIETLNTFKLKWPNAELNSKFGVVEISPYACESDIIYANVELIGAFPLSINGTLDICDGDDTVLTAETTMAGAYSYKWSTGETTKNITVNRTGDYSVTVTDTGDSQKVTKSVHVNVQSPPTVNIDKHLIVDFAGQTVDINEPGCTYLWSDGSKNSQLAINVSGDYWVEKTSALACVNRYDFKAKLRADLFNINLAPAHTSCEKDILLNPSFDKALAYTYLWSNGATTANTTVAKSGNYSLTVTDPDGFSQSANTNVQINSLPIVDLGGDFTLWEGETKLLNAGNDGANFSWNTGAKSQQITVDKGGEYEVTVTDLNACTNKDKVTVDYKTGMRYDFKFDNDKPGICEGDSLLLSAIVEGSPIAPLSYSWDGGEKSDTPEKYLKTVGEHVLTVEDNAKNVVAKKINLIVLKSPLVDLGEDKFLINESSVELQNLADNKVELDYSWSDGAISKTTTVSESGKYWLDVISPEKCKTADTINIVFKDQANLIGVPTAFSPNGDNVNDRLELKGIRAKSFKFIILNKMGQLIFESSSLSDSWDGTYKSKPQKIGSYVYILNMVLDDDSKEKVVGTISLLR